MIFFQRAEEAERRAQEKRSRAGRERRERLARKNVREECQAKDIAGHRGEDQVENLLAYIEGAPAAPLPDQVEPQIRSDHMCRSLEAWSDESTEPIPSIVT